MAGCSRSHEMTRNQAIRLLAGIVGSIGAALGQEWAWISPEAGGKEVFGLRLDRFDRFEVWWGDEVERIPAQELWDAIKAEGRR